MKIILVLIFAFLFLLPLVISQNLTIINPSSESIQDSNRVLFNLTASNESFYYYISDLNSLRPWIKICLNIGKNCSKNLNVNEGENEFNIKAVDRDGNIDIKNVSFNVDSKKPVVLETFPKQSSIVNGSLFYLKYTEENLKNITLFYGVSGNVKSVSNSSDCASGKIKQCNFSINISDLSEFNGKDIWFWFNIRDSFNNIQSKKTKIKIDTEPPIIKEFINITEGHRVRFIFEVKEENLDKIYYKDDSSCGPVFTPSGLLCSRLRDNRCDVTKNFCLGYHNLTIFLADKAGNSAIQNTNFILF